MSGDALRECDHFAEMRAILEARNETLQEMKELVIMWFEKTLEEEQRAAKEASMREEEMCPD